MVDLQVLRAQTVTQVAHPFSFKWILLMSRQQTAGLDTSASVLPVEEEVGRIRVLGIDGPMAIAVVVKDSLRTGGAKLPKVPKSMDRPSRSGDLAIASIKKKKKKKKARALAPA